MYNQNSINIAFLIGRKRGAMREPVSFHGQPPSSKGCGSYLISVPPP
jgi:hypothetical protein